MMNLFAGQQWRHRHREQTYGHGMGEEGEMDEKREWHGNIYTTICKIAIGNLLMKQGTQTGCV